MSTHLRPAAVAGLFYPGSPDHLSRDIVGFLADAEAFIAPRLKAIVVPHAGYAYSGPIAASAYALLASRRATIRRVVLLGPVHRTAVQGLALPACEAFATPLGTVAIDAPAVEAIRELPQVVVDAAAHRQEHALEVQIPFLQTLLDSFTLLPLAVGEATPQQVAAVLDRLWGGDETLIVVSTDLSHYLAYDDAHQVDMETAEQILRLALPIRHFQACGATPLNGLLLAARQRGMQVRQLDLRNSGDTAGDRRRVVGYAAFAFLETSGGQNESYEFQESESHVD